STWKKGADKGPAALIAASANMELFDIATRSEVYRQGIHTLAPIKHAGSPESLANKVEAAMGKLSDARKFPVPLPAHPPAPIGPFRACANRLKNLAILQIDAHGDTREEYHSSACNHACVMARARELCPITQVGVRAIDIEEWPGMNNPRTFWGHEIAGCSD